MPIEMLTYDVFGARLDISAEAARAVARRLRLPRSRSDDGKTLVSVDMNEIRHTRRAPTGRAEKMAELEAEIARLASTVAMHRTDFERERERADHLAAELAAHAADAMAAKETASRLEGELAALRTDVREQPVAVHRADFERERERADHLAAELATLAADVISAKETASRLEGELAALRTDVREQPSSRLGRLAASVIEADRRACR